MTKQFWVFLPGLILKMWSFIIKRFVHCNLSISSSASCTRTKVNVLSLMRTSPKLDGYPYSRDTVYTRAISLTATTPRGNRDKYDQTFFEREYEKTKNQMNPDMDDPTEIIEKMTCDQARRERAMKYARVTRLFPQPQEKRTLTWDTIEQIRFLKQEHSDEWTVSRLATSFDVTENVIKKVLKSKFVPSGKQKLAQDKKAKLNTGLLTSGSDLNVGADTGDYIDIHGSVHLLEDNRQDTQIMLTAGKFCSTQHDNISKVAPRYQSKCTNKQNKQVLNQRHTGTSNKDIASETYKMSDASHYQEGIDDIKSNKAYQTHSHRKGPASRAKKQHKQSPNNVHANCFDNNAKKYELTYNPYEDDSDEPLKVIQRGREFYDENGELLYRI